MDDMVFKNDKMLVECMTDVDFWISFAIGFSLSHAFVSQKCPKMPRFKKSDRSLSKKADFLKKMANQECFSTGNYQKCTHWPKSRKGRMSISRKVKMSILGHM